MRHERLAPPPARSAGLRSEIRPSGINGQDLVARVRQTLHQRPPLREASAPASETSLADEPDEPRYGTCWGRITFADLYQRTQRIAGSVLVRVHGMTNPEDVDDCLQAGYLKVWQRLSKEPDWLIDKPRRYIVQAVVLQSKSQRFSHYRHYRKMVWDAEPHTVGHMTQISHLETWLDLQQALSQVATAVEDKPALLLAFYSLITGTQVEAVAAASTYSAKTLYKHRPTLRQALAQALPGYGPAARETGLELCEQPDQRESVSWHLLNDVSPLVHQPAVEQELTRLVRSAPIPDRRYVTRWHDRQTLEEIIRHPTVRRAAYAKARQLGLEDDDAEDCIQQGCIRLWQRLSQQPNLLVDKGPVWAGIYIVYSGDPKSFHRHYQRRKRFTDPAFDWDAADEHLALGLPDQRLPDWTQAVDEQLDISRFMGIMAAHYANDTRKLLALYALTTSVQTRDVAALMDVHEKNYAAAVGNGVKKTVQQAGRAFFGLDHDNPSEPMPSVPASFV